MGFSMQFRKMLGHKVLVEDKRGRVIVGELTGEDKWFVYLEKAIVRNGEQSREVPAVALHKKALSFIEVITNEA